MLCASLFAVNQHLMNHACLLQGGPLPEERARRLFQQLIVAIDFCHRLGIANRDIKVLHRLCFIQLLLITAGPAWHECAASAGQAW